MIENYKVEFFEGRSEQDRYNMVFHLSPKDNLEKIYKLLLGYNKKSCLFDVIQLGTDTLEDEEFKKISRFLFDKTRELLQDTEKENSKIEVKK